MRPRGPRLGERIGSRTGTPARRLALGTSTEAGGQAGHRVGKLAALGIVHGRWLDVGCASGHYTIALGEAGADSVVGIDIAEERLAEARRRWANTDDVTFHVQDIEDSTFSDASFDGILLNEVLEHVPSEERALAEMWRLLVDGGHLCVFSPNRWFPFEGHRLLVGSRELRPPVPVVPWLPRRATQRYMVARNYWPRELRRLVTDAGFETVYLGSAFPRFGIYKWLPESLIPAWRAAIPTLETLPLICRFGVSTLVVARKIPAAAGSPSRSAAGSS